MHEHDSPSPALQLDNVSLQLTSANGAVPILDSVSLRVAREESVAIVGPSGSGKTSLLMIAAGLEPATQGQVAVNGERIDAMNEDARARFRGEHIGIVFQAFHLMPTMTALENVALPLELHGERRPWEQAKQALDAVGLSPRLSHYPAQLSGGEQQRVAVARALVRRPSLIIADEPTGNLDRETGHHIIDLLFSVQQSTKATLLLITHDAELAARCQRTIRLRDGRIEAMQSAT
ncbi:MAG: ATP-binding cassette domain-containing protein [Rickettsiales bacterium]|nr:ATP-binding cassette domain-containing protein [Rickettsiales bacterium]